jgi:hypothetical protein
MFSGNPSSSELENGAQKDPSKTLLTKEDLDGVKKTITSLINPENISLLKVGVSNQIVMLNIYYKCQ